MVNGWILKNKREIAQTKKKYQARLVTLGKNVLLEAVAQMTPGFSGANLVNEAALLASRHGKEAVDMADFDEAFERVVAGSERRTRSVTPQEKKVIAVHEAGHALIASLTPEADKVHKVTIVPRGQALGYTIGTPREKAQNELRRLLREKPS